MVQIPLIRASGLRRFLFGMLDAGMPVDRTLTEVGLDAYPWDTPEAPIPMAAGFELFGRVAEREGRPDMGCEWFDLDGLADFGIAAHVLVGSRTPREALTRLSAAIPYFCSHERFELASVRGHPVVRAVFHGPIDPVGNHIAQQISVRVIMAIVGAAEQPEPPILRVELPQCKMVRARDLEPWLGETVLTAPSRGHTVFLRKEALDAPFPAPLALPEPAPALPPSWLRLQETPSLAEAVKILIDEMLVEGMPTVDQVARRTRLSRRSLQRMLARAGTSFTILLDEVRRERALAWIETDDRPLASLSGELGYATAASFSRACRRWTDASARDLRKRGKTRRP